MGWLGDSYLSGGLFLHFSICDCKERILVAGWCTDLVRGTKTAKKKKRGGGGGEKRKKKIKEKKKEKKKREKKG